MMYSLMTLDDNTEIVHSEMGKDGFSQKVEKAWMLYGIPASGTMRRMKKY